MNTYAIVSGDIVTNVILWDGNTDDWRPPAGSTANLIPTGEQVGPGYTFNGTSYAPPEE
jgi:hypothetical protein